MNLPLRQLRTAVGSRKQGPPWANRLSWAAVPLLALCAALPAAGASVTAPRDSWDLGDDSDVRRAAFSPDGKTLALYDYGEDGVTLWDVTTQKKVATLKKDGWKPSGEFIFTPDGKTLLTRGVRSERKGSDFLRQDSVVAWDLKGFAEQSASDLEVPGMGGLGTFTPDGKTLVVAAPAFGVAGATAFDPATGKKIKALDPDLPAPGAPTALTVSCDGKTLALGTKDGVILVWDLEKGKVLQTIQTARGNVLLPAFAVPPNPPLDPRSQIELLTFSPDGKMLASYARSDNKVDLWDPAKGKNLDFLRPDPWLGQPTALAFSPDGKTLAFGAKRGGRVPLWSCGISPAVVSAPTSRRALPAATTCSASLSPLTAKPWSP
jgi:WD40 repeat protein